MFGILGWAINHTTRIKREKILTVKTRNKFPIVYPSDNEEFTRIQGLIPSSTCIPLQGERRQDDERRHSDLYSRVNPVIYPNLVVLIHLTVAE